MSKKINKPLEDLLQKIINAKGKDKELLIKILKVKFPDARVPK